MTEAQPIGHSPEIRIETNDIYTEIELGNNIFRVSDGEKRITKRGDVAIIKPHKLASIGCIYTGMFSGEGTQRNYAKESAEVARTEALARLEHLQISPPYDLSDIAHKTINNIKNRISPPSSEHPNTSATIIFINGKEIEIANVGNNRCYILRDGKLIRITTDQLRTFGDGMLKDKKAATIDVIANATASRSINNPEHSYAFTRRREKDSFPGNLIGRTYHHANPDYYNFTLADSDIFITLNEGIHSILCESLPQGSHGSDLTIEAIIKKCVDDGETSAIPKKLIAEAKKATHNGHPFYKRAMASRNGFTETADQDKGVIVFQMPGVRNQNGNNIAGSGAYEDTTIQELALHPLTPEELEKEIEYSLWVRLEGTLSRDKLIEAIEEIYPDRDSLMKSKLWIDNMRSISPSQLIGMLESENMYLSTDLPNRYGLGEAISALQQLELKSPILSREYPGVRSKYEESDVTGAKSFAELYVILRNLPVDYVLSKDGSTHIPISQIIDNIEKYIEATDTDEKFAAQHITRNYNLREIAKSLKAKYLETIKNGRIKPS